MHVKLLIMELDDLSPGRGRRIPAFVQVMVLIWSKKRIELLNKSYEIRLTVTIWKKV